MIEKNRIFYQKSQNPGTRILVAVTPHTDHSSFYNAQSDLVCYLGVGGASLNTFLFNTGRGLALNLRERAFSQHFLNV